MSPSSRTRTVISYTVWTPVFASRWTLHSRTLSFPYRAADSTDPDGGILLPREVCVWRPKLRSCNVIAKARTRRWRLCHRLPGLSADRNECFFQRYSNYRIKITAGRAMWAFAMDQGGEEDKLRASGASLILARFELPGPVSGHETWDKTRPRHNQSRQPVADPLAP